MQHLCKSLSLLFHCLDRTNRNIAVDSIINNIYIETPDSSVSVQAILSAMATKIGPDGDNLVILDVKFLEIADDKGNTAIITNFSILQNDIAIVR